MPNPKCPRCHKLGSAWFPHPSGRKSRTNPYAICGKSMGMYGSAGYLEEQDCPLSWGETLGFKTIPKTRRNNRKSRRSRKARRNH